MMLCSRVSNYIIFLLFVFLGSFLKAESFEIVRGIRDIFTNPKCEKRCNNCDSFKATCVSDTCSWCKCPENNNTFIPEHSNAGKCVNEKFIVPESVISDDFFGIAHVSWSGELKCVASKKSLTRIPLETCNPNDLNGRWMWTHDKRLMNIETLKCITIESSEVRIAPCSFARQQDQKFDCIASIKRLWFSIKYGNQYLRKEYQKDYVVLGNGRKRWKIYNGIHHKACTKSNYKGCYRFADGTFSQLIKTDMCHGKDPCYTKHIKAPIFIENNKCAIEWSDSEYLKNDGDWESAANDFQPYLSKVVHDRKIKIQIQPGIFKQNILENGILLKLGITCNSGEESADKSSETHCVILKFVAVKLPVTRTTTRPIIKPPIITQPIIKTSQGPDRVPSITDSTMKTSAPPVITQPSPEADPRKGESANSGKTAAISVTIVLVIIIVLLVLGYLWYHKRRKSRVPEQNNTTQVSKGNPTTSEKVIYEETNDVYEAIKENDLDKGTNNNVYSYASTRGLSRPLPSPPPNVHHTPEENPKVEYDTVVDAKPNKINSNKPIYEFLEESQQENKTDQRPVYHTLEDDQSDGVDGGYDRLAENQVQDTPQSTRNPADTGIYNQVDENIPIENEYSYADREEAMLSLPEPGSVVYNTLEEPDTPQSVYSAPEV